jgi:type VII secretion protein EccB
LASRQDQLHSYQFMIQRVVSALVTRETDPARPQLRRTAGTTLAGVLLAAIALAATAGYGLVTGGGATDWRAADTVIVEKETGEKFVWYDETLHPVRNYASALLIVGSTDARRVSVSRRSLDGEPRGEPLGVPDLPDSLPEPGRLRSGPWSLCSTTAEPRPGGIAGADGPPRPARSVLLVGAAAGGAAAGGVAALGAALGDSALLVTGPGGDRHLIWQRRRHLVRDAQIVLAALGWSGAEPVPVAGALLNGLPAGPDLGRMVVPFRGQPSAVGADLSVGQVIVVDSRSGAEQYAVVLRDGVAPITQLQADLVLTDPRTRDLVGRDGPVALSQAEFAALPQLPPSAVDGAALPARAPELAGAAGGVVCAVVPDDAGVASVAVGGTLPPFDRMIATAGRSADRAVLADYVAVPGGAGAVVESVAAPGATGGAVSVVTEQGRRFVAPGPEVLAMLGYGSVTAIRLPAELVALVPAGPALDPEQARRPTLSG